MKKAGLFYDIVFQTKKIAIAIAICQVVLISLTLLQDFLRSLFTKSSFYLSESLLFNSFWLIFLPLLLLEYKILQYYKAKHSIHQILILVLLFVAIHLLVFPSLIWLLSFLFFDHTYSVFQTLNYTLSEHVYILVLIYGSFAIFIKDTVFKKIEKTIENDEKNATSSISKITLSNGRKYVSIAVQDILYIKAATPYVDIRVENKHYLHSETLKSIAVKLDNKGFVRVHKSTIINTAKVASYKSRLNGDYDIVMTDGSEIRLSRNYALQFKEVLTG